MEKLDQIFEFVNTTCDEYSIDESHGLKHSLDVYEYAQQIYMNELKSNHGLETRHQVIMYSAALHDMCDYKYMDENQGLKRIIQLLEEHTKLDTQSINLICKIIASISYTKVKKVGYPKFSDPLDQLSYHIVREADLLTAYDFDRSVVYAMINKKMLWSESVNETIQYFKTRVLTQISDGLYITTWGLQKAQELHDQALVKVRSI